MRKFIPVVTVGVTALAVAGGTFAYAAETQDVTLSVDGAARQLSSRSDTVGDVLRAEGVTVGARDVVAPALDAPVSDGSRIAVQFARPVTVTVDGRAHKAWTTATRVDQALAALKVDTRGAALSVSRSSAVPRQGVSLAVATRKTMTVNAAGRVRRVETTARTVADVLRAQKITVDADDKLNVPATTPLTDGAAIVYTRVDTATLSKRRSVSYDTTYDRTSSLNKGVRKVKTAGHDGTKTLTYREVRANGQVVSRKQTNSTVTTKPRDRVVLVGTKVVAPKPKSQPKAERRSDASSSKRSSSKSSSSKSSSSSSKGTSAPKVASGGVWDKLARCESGGNWSINTGNGYYGGLQFTKSTWRAFGGSGMPHHASRARQIAVAKKVKSSQGWGAWPGCTRKLGIR